MIDYKKELFSSLQNYTTPYKFFLLLFLFKEVNPKMKFTKSELAKGIILEAWPYIRMASKRLTFYDRSYDAVWQIIENSDGRVNIDSSRKDILDYFSLMKPKELRVFKKFENMAPYRILVDNCLSKDLRNKNDVKKNSIIEQYSQTHILLYVITGNNILLNYEYAAFILDHRNDLISELDKIIVEKFC